MQKQAELIERFNQARETMRELLPAIDVHTEIYPGWTMKEVLSHLAGWDDSTVQALQIFAAGAPPLITAMRGVDFHNAQTVAERKELTYEQVVREWEWVREQLIPIIEQLSAKDLATSLVAPWGEKLTVLDILTIMIEHEEEHAEIIRARIENPSEPPQAH